MPIKFFGNKSAKAALNEYNDTPRVPVELPYSFLQDDSVEILWGVLDGTLTAAPSPGSPTTATLSVYSPITWTDTGRNITVTNRGSTAQSAGTYLAVYRVYDSDTFFPIGSGGSGGVTAASEVWQIYVFGNPTGGTFDIDVSIAGGSYTNLTFNYNDTAAAVVTEFNTHPDVTSGEVTASGGPFPLEPIQVNFVSTLGSQEIGVDAPIPNYSSLTGGTGDGVVVARWTKGST